MKSVYINLYNKEIFIDLIRTLYTKKFKIYSQGSTYNYLLNENIEVENIKSNTIHPNFIIIDDINNISKNSKIPSLKLIVADLVEDDYYNSVLIYSALKKNIPVVMDKESAEKLSSFLNIFDDISENLKKELIAKSINKLLYHTSLKIYERFPYIEMYEFINIPLKKIKDFSYGENPHQKAALYSLPIQSDFDFSEIKILNGEINFNHFLDIYKSYQIFSELSGHSCAMALRHSNIANIIINENRDELIKQLITSTSNNMIYAFNQTLNIEDINSLNTKNPELVITPSLTDDVIIKINKNKISTKIALIPLHHIKAPMENEIIILSSNALIQTRNTYSPRFITLTNTPLLSEFKVDAELAGTVMKNSKTYSALLVMNKTLIAKTEGESSSEEAVKVMIAKAESKLHDKNMIKFKANNMIVAVEGNLKENMIENIIKLPVKVIMTDNKNTDENVLKTADKHGICVIATEKRHFKHF